MPEPDVESLELVLNLCVGYAGTGRAQLVLHVTRRKTKKRRTSNKYRVRVEP